LLPLPRAFNCSICFLPSHGVFILFFLSLCFSFGFFFSDFFIFYFFFFFWSPGGGGQEQQKREEKDEEEVNLLQPNPYKLIMVVEVCCHCQELSIAAKVFCLHMEFFIQLF